MMLKLKKVISVYFSFLSIVSCFLSKEIGQIPLFVNSSKLDNKDKTFDNIFFLEKTVSKGALYSLVPYFLGALYSKVSYFPRCPIFLVPNILVPHFLRCPIF